VRNYWLHAQVLFDVASQLFEMRLHHLQSRREVLVVTHTVPEMSEDVLDIVQEASETGVFALLKTFLHELEVHSVFVQLRGHLTWRVQGRKYLHFLQRTQFLQNGLTRLIALSTVDSPLVHLRVNLSWLALCALYLAFWHGRSRF